MAKNERADRYEAKDIGTYAGANGPQNFRSLYPNLNMPQGVIDYRFNTAPQSALTYNTNMPPTANMGRDVATPNPNANFPMGAGQQQLPSMQPSQSMMPDFLQMALSRYMGNAANRMPANTGQQPQQATTGQGIDESGGMGNYGNNPILPLTGGPMQSMNPTNLQRMFSGGNAIQRRDLNQPTPYNA